jgi:hypothetical protein
VVAARPEPAGEMPGRPERHPGVRRNGRRRPRRGPLRDQTTHLRPPPQGSSTHAPQRRAVARGCLSRQRRLTPQNLRFAAVPVGFAGWDGWGRIRLCPSVSLLPAGSSHGNAAVGRCRKMLQSLRVWRFIGNPDTEKETIMREMFSGSMITVAIAGAAVGVISLSVVGTQAQGPAASGTAPAAAALKTPWGEPDLQGIWTDETDTPFQRSPKFANQEFFTEAQRAELDQLRSASLGREKRFERGTEADVAGAYNDVFTPKKRTGVRTSRIVDPPNGRLPPMTPEAQKIAAAEREFRVALLQATETCKNKEPACAGGKYDPVPSVRFAERAPRYNLGGMNRHDGPEDGGAALRCLPAGCPSLVLLMFACRLPTRSVPAPRFLRPSR